MGNGCTMQLLDGINLIGEMIQKFPHKLLHQRITNYHNNRWVRGRSMTKTSTHFSTPKKEADECTCWQLSK
jgi:hypothetical protein